MAFPVKGLGLPFFFFLNAPRHFPSLCRSAVCVCHSFLFRIDTQLFVPYLHLIVTFDFGVYY